MLGFVDDSNGITNLPPGQTSISDLLTRVQHDSQLWHDLLWLSGGKLELSKCSFHVLAFDFNTAGCPFPITRESFQLPVKDENNAAVSIEYKTVYKSHKTLGHHKSPCGNSATQLKAMISKGTKLATQLKRCPIWPIEAKILYESVVVPAVGFPLPQSRLTEKQIRQIMQKVMPSII